MVELNRGGRSGPALISITIIINNRTVIKSNIKVLFVFILFVQYQPYRKTWCKKKKKIETLLTRKKRTK